MYVNAQRRQKMKVKMLDKEDCAVAWNPHLVWVPLQYSTWQWWSKTECDASLFAVPMLGIPPSLYHDNEIVFTHNDPVLQQMFLISYRKLCTVVLFCAE